MSDWEDIERPTNYFKMEQPGDSIEGIYLGTRPGTYEGQPTVQQWFKLAHGTEQYISGTKQLNELLAVVTVGSPLRVVFDSNVKKKQGPGTFRFFKAQKPKQQATA